jgi:hypothetical protein
VGFDVLTTCQPSTVWCSRERLPAAAAQPAKARQSCSATDLFILMYDLEKTLALFSEICHVFVHLNIVSPELITTV